MQVLQKIQQQNMQQMMVQRRMMFAGPGVGGGPVSLLGAAPAIGGGRGGMLRIEPRNFKPPQRVGGGGRGMGGALHSGSKNSARKPISPLQSQSLDDDLDAYMNARKPTSEEAQVVGGAEQAEGEEEEGGGADGGEEVVVADDEVGFHLSVFQFVFLPL
jgi:hypothetical protein